MEISKFSTALALFAVLLVTGCTQTFSNTTFIVNPVYLTDSLRMKIVEGLYSKAAELGGQCKLVNIARDFYSCQISTQKPGVSVDAGFNTQGTYIINIESTYVHWIPPKRENVISGQFVGDIHFDLENWVETQIPSEAIFERKRVYLGYE